MVSPLLRKLGRDARRHRAQFIAVTVTMFLGVALFGASYDSFQNLTASYDSTATEYRFANLTVAGGDVAGLAATTADDASVESVELRTVSDVPFDVGGTKLLGRIVGMPAAGQPDVNRIEVLEGSYLDPSIPSGILVEQHMADHFSLAVGDTLAMRAGGDWIDATVLGVAASPEYIWPARDRQNVITSPDNFGVVFGPEDLARTVAGDGPNEAAFFFTGGRPDEALETSLTDAAYTAGATRVTARADQASNAALEEDLAGFEEMAVFFPILFLAAAAMAAYVTISRLVATQRPYIGVMTANGFTRGQILRHYLGYGLLPGLAGAVPGAVAGSLLARVVTGLYTQMLAVPVTVIRFYPATLLLSVGFGLVAALLAGLAPALAASRVQPAVAMRGETPPSRTRRSLVERFFPPARLLPVRWRMALRSAGRNPRRALYTMVGVVLSLTLVLVSWGMIDTIQYLMNRQFVEIQQEDGTVYFTSPVAATEAAALVGEPGVAAAEPVLEIPVSVSSATGHYDTVLVALDADTQMHRFLGTDGRWRDLPSDGILVGAAFADLLGIEAGDTVTVSSDLGPAVDQPVAGFLDEPLGSMAYVSRAHLEEVAGTSLPATAAYVRYDEGADGASVRADLMALPDVAAFEDAKAIYRTMQDLMVLFYAFVGVMLAFGAAMAFALIFNSMSVNIAERSREVATLLAVGTERRTISRLITLENLLVAVPGIPIGLVAGYFVSQAAMASFQSDLFAFDLHMRATTLLLAAAAIVVVALASQIPGLRALRRLNIPRIVKERAA